MELKLQKPSKKLILPALAVVAILVNLLVLVLDQTTKADQNVALVANQDIASGDQITESNTTAITLSLSSGGYLKQLRLGQVATQTILKGQLIPRQAVASSTDPRTPIRFNNLDPISEQLSVGDHVDIWATPTGNQPGQGAEVIAFDAIVTKVINSSNMAINQTSVELRVHPEYLTSVFEAKANRLSIDLVISETIADLP